MNSCFWLLSESLPEKSNCIGGVDEAASFRAFAARKAGIALSLARHGCGAERPFLSGGG